MVQNSKIKIIDNENILSNEQIKEIKINETYLTTALQDQLSTLCFVSAFRII